MTDEEVAPLRADLELPQPPRRVERRVLVSRVVIRAKALSSVSAALVEAAQGTHIIDRHAVCASRYEVLVVRRSDDVKA